MTMNWQEFGALIALASAMTFTPGPNTALSTALAANHGFKHALRFICAVPAGWAILLTLCASGVGAMILAAPNLQLGFKWVGAIYLLWLAWRLAQVKKLKEAESAMFELGFWKGTALQLVNFKAWMLALTIASGWIVGHADAISRFFWVLPILLFFAFFSNLMYALLGSMLRTWLALGSRLLWFNRFMSALLVSTAFWTINL